MTLTPSPLFPNGVSPSSFPSAPQVASPFEPGTRDAELWAAAQSMEASFLSLMLEDAGVGAVPSAFGGGAGEEHFASFLRDEQAREMVSAGGIGLAETLFEAMKGQGNV